MPVGCASAAGNFRISRVDPLRRRSESREVYVTGALARGSPCLRIRRARVRPARTTGVTWSRSSACYLRASARPIAMVPISGDSASESAGLEQQAAVGRVSAERHLPSRVRRQMAQA